MHYNWRWIIIQLKVSFFLVFSQRFEDFYQELLKWNHEYASLFIRINKDINYWDQEWTYLDLIWFEFIHSYDIDLSLIHEKNYVIYINNNNNNSYILVTLIRSTHEKNLCYVCQVNKTLWDRKSLAVYTTTTRSQDDKTETMYQICSRWSLVKEWVFLSF